MQYTSADRYSDFCQFLSEIRRFFTSQGFLETPTPTLVSCPGMEAHLEPIATSSGHFLPTSPEIHLKRLLCQGFEQIFELRPCFRNDPKTSTHLKEFMMLEWYRKGHTHERLVEDIQSLLMHLSAAGFWPHSTTVNRRTFKSLFKELLDFEFRPETSEAELKALFQAKGLYSHESDTKEDLIHRLLIERFEPSFAGLTILMDFPPEMAVLSRIGSQGFAERFEVFFGEMELANAFHEVSDPRVQRQRWEKDLEDRRQIGVQLLEPDQNLLRDMETLGLPNCAGIALGVDRLYMAARDLKEITQIRPF